MALTRPRQTCDTQRAGVQPSGLSMRRGLIPRTRMSGTSSIRITYTSSGPGEQWRKRVLLDMSDSRRRITSYHKHTHAGMYIPPTTSIHPTVLCTCCSSVLVIVTPVQVAHDTGSVAIVAPIAGKLQRNLHTRITVPSCLTSRVHYTSRLKTNTNMHSSSQG